MAHPFKNKKQGKSPLGRHARWHTKEYQDLRQFRIDKNNPDNYYYQGDTGREAAAMIEDSLKGVAQDRDFEMARVYGPDLQRSYEEAVDRTDGNPDAGGWIHLDRVKSGDLINDPRYVNYMNKLYKDPTIWRSEYDERSGRVNTYPRDINRPIDLGGGRGMYIDSDIRQKNARRETDERREAAMERVNRRLNR